MKRTLTGIAAAAAAWSSASASQITIDFDNALQNVSISPYLEDGFLVNGSATDTGIVSSGELSDFIFEPGEFFTLSRVDLGDFSAVSFDYRSSIQGFQSDGFKVTGRRNGLEVVDYGSFSTSSGSRVTADLMNSILIDELVLTGSGLNSASIQWDNFVFDAAAPVPVPAAAPLMLAGLSALALGHRRKAA
ncbi:MAG: hypothetical protein AAFX52_02700 [Pseudomonadota bacterium]